MNCKSFTSIFVLTISLLWVFSPPAIAVSFTAIQILTNPRGDEANAIDQNNATFSYLTAPFSSGSITALLDLGSPTDLSGFRFLKQTSDVDALTPNNPDHSDLTFRVSTTPTSTALSSRVYTPVLGLTNGYNGSELLVLDVGGTVNPVTATITQEFGPGPAWYSVSFNTVLGATALAFQFGPSAGESVSGPQQQFTHYPVAEFQAIAVQEPSSMLLFAIGTLLMFGIKFV